MVSPPPGVSSGSSDPPIAFGEAAGQREAKPHAGGVVVVAEPLERDEDPHPVGLRDAGAAVHHQQLDPVVPTELAVSFGGSSGGE